MSAPRSFPLISMSEVSDFSSKVTMQRALHDPSAPAVSELEFGPDELGEGFGYYYVEMGKDPDKEAPVRFTLVRYRPEADDQPDGSAWNARPAILMVHGMTDYFFHKNAAKIFTAQGYAVYGLDLRKCGRSWREGQTWHHVSSQSLYGEDLTIAASLITKTHPNLVVLGHSNGGLGVTMWAARLHRDAVDMPESPQAQLFSRLSGVILNSPWFGLQFDAITRLTINKVMPVLSRFQPNMVIKGGINPLYGLTLHTSKAGEWDYNLELKPLYARPKTISWITGVGEEIRELQTGNYSTGVPTLLLCSDKHYFGRKMDERAFTSDVILKPEQMRQFAPHANKDAEVAVIPDALHDVFLSRKPVRDHAFEVTLEWLQEVAPTG